jgi:hypothetical protein
MNAPDRLNGQDRSCVQAGIKSRTNECLPKAKSRTLFLQNWTLISLPIPSDSARNLYFNESLRMTVILFSLGVAAAFFVSSL